MPPRTFQSGKPRPVAVAAARKKARLQLLLLLACDAAGEDVGGCPRVKAGRGTLSACALGLGLAHKGQLPLSPRVRHPFHPAPCGLSGGILAPYMPASAPGAHVR